MKISEFIELLNKLMAAEGDLEVEHSNFCGDRIEHSGPRLDHRAVLTGCESKQRFASDFKYGRGGMEGRVGEPVCRL